MKIFLSVFALAVLLVASSASAQIKPVDANRAKFTWEYSGPGQPTEFRIKCGTQSGKHTTVKVIADPAARSYLFKDMALGNGVYYCVMTAFNAFSGETPPTPEIFFSAGEGASTPINFTIGG